MPNLDVGRYAVYVWPAYALSAAVITALVVDSVARARRWRRAAERNRPPPPPEGRAEPRP